MTLTPDSQGKRRRLARRQRHEHVLGDGQHAGSRHVSPVGKTAAWERRLVRVACYAWAAPTTMVGLLTGVLTLGTGGRAQLRRGALEFHGGFARWLADRIGFEAMTLGHVILGRTAWALDALREHEQAHVRQVEMWGPAFIPAYLAASLLAWYRGGHYYFDNYFEFDARRACGEEIGPWTIPACGTALGKSLPQERSLLMPQTPHIERHFTASEKVRDLVIGMSDGLTVPFALAAGLSGSPLASSAIVVTAGLAEVAAGSIAMGLGGYLAARSDAEHFANEKRREEREVRNVPDIEEVEVAEVFQKYGLADEEIEPILRAFRKNHPAWVDFMMRFELGLEEPDPSRAVSSALTIAGAYIAGGLIPLVPYMLIPSTHAALRASVAVTLLALLIFGYVKGRFTGTRPLRSALQTMLIGGLAATAAFLIAREFS
ncbi:MAG: VIT1/CCC1 transporter family protein [Planctomycetaceae bacterium]|nr:VIT1/CCC1 transporter family protein [Planctomycetaceae bacterium]